LSLLALRALKWGTLLAIIGTGSFCFGVYKLTGARDVSINNLYTIYTNLYTNILIIYLQLKEFRTICGNVLPKIPKNKEPQSRTEFENLSDFMSYISQWKK
jgi:hypothetical protein